MVQLPDKLRTVEHGILKTLVERDGAVRTGPHTQLTEHAGAKIVLVADKTLFLLAIFRLVKFALHRNGAVRACHLAQTAPHALVLVVLVVGHRERSAETVEHFQLLAVLGILLGHFGRKELAHRRLQADAQRFDAPEQPCKICFIFFHNQCSFTPLEMKSISCHDGHNNQVDQADGHEVFPFESQDLVDTQAGERPADPHEQKDNKERLAYKPDDAGDIVHNTVEPVQADDMQRRPASEEDGRGDTRRDEQVQILGKVVEAEVHTRVFRMITSRELAFALGQVERAAVTLGVACYQIDKEGDDGGHVSAHDVPALGILLLDDFRNLQRSGERHHGEHGQADRELIADDEKFKVPFISPPKSS